MSTKTSSEWLEKAFSTEMTMSESCKLLWTDENPLYDAAIKVMGQLGEPEAVFKVHKLILAIGSKKFASDLYVTTLENSSIMAMDIPFNIEVENISPSTMKRLLEFLYTGNVHQSMLWPELGGLMNAAKQYGIPRLVKHCTSLFEKDLSCDQILVLFQQLIALTEEQYNWPKYYYLELLKLCFSYILRNGEVVLRSRTFRSMYMRSIELFIGSDYFLAEELTVYRALKKWARSQCRNINLDPENLENCKKVLRRAGDDTESVGLLEYVRFPVMDSDTFSYDIQKPTSSLITKKIADLVYRYYEISEPTELFSEKERFAEINKENETQFNEHIDQLCGLVGSHTPSVAKRNARSGIECVESKPDVENCPPSDIIDAISDSESHSDLRTNCANAESKTKSVVKESSVPETIEILQSVPVSHSTSTPLGKINQNETNYEPNSKKCMLKRKGDALVFAESKTSSPGKMQKVGIGKELKIQDNTRNMEKQASATILDSDEEKILCTGVKMVKTQMKYEDVIKFCLRQLDVTDVGIEHIEIDLNNAKPDSWPSVCLPKLRTFVLTACVCKKKADLIKILRNLNLEHYVFFYPKNVNSKYRLMDIWEKQIKVSLNFNGVTLFKTGTDSLTLNYTRNSSFFALDAQSLDDISTLNIGNCVLKQNHWLKRKNAESLLALGLFCVKGLKLHDVLAECKTLESLSVWAEDTQIPSISLDDIVSENLKTLSVKGHMIKFSPGCVIPKVETICFINCSWDPDFVEKFTRIFPNLSKIFIYDGFHPPGADLLKELVSKSSIREIGMWNFNVKSLEQKEFLDLKNFFKNLNIKKDSNEGSSFKLERESATGWAGANATSPDLSKQIFERFNLKHLYSFYSWTKYIWVNYDIDFV